MVKKKRLNTFTVDAESVQGIEGTTITFKRLKRREYLAWRNDPDTTDDDLAASHTLSWRGIVDENNNELPSPTDEPGGVDENGYELPSPVFGELYFEEIPKIAALLLQGPDGPDALKN